jgi:hypothetical protein
LKYLSILLVLILPDDETCAPRDFNHNKGVLKSFYTASADYSLSRRAENDQSGQSRNRWIAHVFLHRQDYQELACTLDHARQPQDHSVHESWVVLGF